MINLSMAQALDIWSDLCDAYHSGTVAEIYLYRFMPYSPTAASEQHCPPSTTLGKQALAEQVKRANESLFALLSHFAKERNCKVKVNDRALGKWVASAGFDHRVYVKVMVKE